MKQAKLLLLFVVAFAMLFAGCVDLSMLGGDRTQSPTSTTAKTEEVTDPPISTTAAPEKAFVRVDYMTDELLGKYDSFIEFEDGSSQKIIFATNVAVKDFKFIEIGLKTQDTDVVFFEDGVLYSLEELTPAMPFVVTWTEWGSIPHRGISFTDETDTTRHFYVTMSGEDGSLLLGEFINE